MALSVPSTIRVLLPGGAVKKLALEEYVRGVVAAALPGDAPLEALKAQAVAARTFGAITRRHLERAADVCTLRHCQVWKESGTSLAQRAADETRGIVAVHDGHLIDAYYFEHCDGNTRDAAGVLVQAPLYLKSVACPCGSSTLKGHGVGMCQRGALVMARFGDGFDAILKHYFAGISLESAGLLSALVPEPKTSSPLAKPSPASAPSPRTSGAKPKSAPKSRSLEKTSRPALSKSSPEMPAPARQSKSVSPSAKSSTGVPPQPAHSAPAAPAPAPVKRTLPIPETHEAGPSLAAPAVPPPDVTASKPPDVAAGVGSSDRLADAKPKDEVQIVRPPGTSEPPVAPQIQVAPPVSGPQPTSVNPPPVEKQRVQEVKPPSAPPEGQPPTPASPPRTVPYLPARSILTAQPRLPPSQAPASDVETPAARADDEIWYPLTEEVVLRADRFGADVIDEELQELARMPPAPETFPEELIPLSPVPDSFPEEMPYFLTEVIQEEAMAPPAPPPPVEEELFESLAAAPPSPVLVDRLPGPRMIVGDLAAPGIIITIRDTGGHSVVTVSGTAPHHGRGGFEARLATDGIYAVTFNGDALDVELRDETVFIQVPR